MIRLGLESITNLCEQLNNPQDGLQFIHIAGTNGKGSTCAFIESILKEAKVKVGVFTSPAVFSREEVIRINKRPITKARYDKEYSIVINACDEIVKRGKDRPTEFEIETALALNYFNEEGCDIVVIECGMGGESDATNIISNTGVCVFTSISIDHTDYLGATIEDIAKIKSGIIKHNSIAVISENNENAIPVIREKAKDNDSYVIMSKVRSFKKGELGLDGICQNENASLAFDAVNAFVSYAKGNLKKINPVLVEKLTAIDDKIIRKGLKNTQNPGRFEKIWDKPVVIIDGAHNKGAAIALKDNLLKYYAGKDIYMISGMLVNKDHKSVMKELAPLAKNIFTVSTLGNRCYGAEELARDVLEYNKNVTAIGGVEEALELSLVLANKSGVIVVFGTFTILEKVKKKIKLWKNMK